MKNIYENPDNQENILELASEEGERTVVTPKVMEVANEIDAENKYEGLDLVTEVCKYVRTMIPNDDVLKEARKSGEIKVFDKWERSADDLLEDKNLILNHRRVRNIDGCTQTAHITRALLLAKGIPCLITDTIHKEWLEDTPKTWKAEDDDALPAKGHYFVEVYIENENKWYTVDPLNREHRIREFGNYSSSNGKYVKMCTAKDAADMGFFTQKDRLIALEKNLKER